MCVSVCLSVCHDSCMYALPISLFYIPTEYAEVADNVKKYFKKLCKRYFNEVYLKEKEEKERTPSPEHEKALKDLKEDESDSDDSSGSDSDTSEFGVSKKNKKTRRENLEKKVNTPGWIHQFLLECGLVVSAGVLWVQTDSSLTQVHWRTYNVWCRTEIFHHVCRMEYRLCPQMHHHTFNKSTTPSCT